MIDSIIHFLRFSPGRILPRYNQYLNNMDIFLNKIRNKFLLFPGSNSQGIRILNHVINLIDLDYCSKLTDIEIYLNYLQHQKSIMDGVFSRTANGRNYANVFVSKLGGTKVPEYLIPVEDITTLSRLPFGKNWLYWKEVKPLKMIYHDSDEYTLELITDQIRFRKNTPSIAIFTIDTISLVLKYISWLREQKKNEVLPDDELFTSFFIHKYVISELYSDLIDIWLLNQVQSVLDGNSITEKYRSIEKHQQYSFIGTRYEEAFSDLELRVGQLKYKAITADSFFNSHLLYSDSPRMIVENLLRVYPTDNLMGGYYLTLLKELSYLELIYSIYSSEPGCPVYPKLQRDGSRRYHRIFMSKPWSRCHYKIVANLLEEKFKAFGNKYF